MVAGVDSAITDFRERLRLHARTGAVVSDMESHIAARIAAGELKPGARLPAERDLAAEYGVSLATGRRADRVLRERGMLVTLPVKGTYVVGRD